MIYAFKDKDYEETMKEHILNGIDFIDKGFLRRGYHIYIAKRLHLLNLKEVSPFDVKKAIAIAYIYHDIGKALQPFQENILCGEGARSHEIFSSIIMFKNFREQSFFRCKALFNACLIAVLLHMSASRGNLISETRLFMKRFSMDAKAGRLYIDESSVDELNRIIGEAWHKLDLGDPVPIVRERPLIISQQDIEKATIALLQLTYGKSPSYYQTMFSAISILHPLLLADCYAASIARKTEERRPFVDEFIEAFAPDMG